VLRTVERIINGLTVAGAVIGGGFTAIMAAVVAYAVFVRYLLNRPIGWSEEVSIYLMIWAVYLGTAYTLKEDAHISVDILVTRVPADKRLYFRLFHYVVGIIFLSLLFYEGLKMVDLSLVLGSRSIALGFPLSIPQLAVPVGAALLILQFLGKLVRLRSG
jgi:TRAP-type C4-dicarboxylate transport system permease small subunit